MKWNQVTWYSRLGTIILFVGVLPVLTFYTGMEYQNVVTLSRSNEVYVINETIKNKVEREEHLDINESIEIDKEVEQENVPKIITTNSTSQVEPFTARDYFIEANTPYPFRARVVKEIDEQSKTYDVVLTEKFLPHENINVPLRIQSDVDMSVVGDVYQIFAQYDSEKDMYRVTVAKNITFRD